MADEERAETVAAVGEFAVIDQLVAGRSQPSTVVIGPGDDAAVMTGRGAIVVSTDMLVEGRHFRLDWSSPYEVGRKAIAQNAADIEAMGAAPTAFVVAFGAPGSTPAEQTVALADGMWDEARTFGAGIVGGDLVSAPQWVISVTVFGDLDERAPVLRSGARPGDTVAVVGTLGRSAAGFSLWENGINGFDALRRVHLTPEPPYGQGRVAADGGATAMTDVSDGLLADLGHIAQASGVGVNVSTAALESDHEALSAAADAAGADAWDWVLGGGEDHALVAAFHGAPPTGWRAIGTVIDAPPRVLVDGEEWSGKTGWQSYD